ncbi:MAG: geranylgeranyl reductase family protein [Bacteroidota bacterium]
MSRYDVIVLGAGPAGSVAALSLKGSGLRVALVDRSAFPRDKVCGDAIGGRVRRVLYEIDPDLAQQLDGLTSAVVAGGWRLVAPSGRSVTARFKKTGLVCARTDFDAFLFAAAKDSAVADVVTGNKVHDIRVSSDGVEVIGDTGNLKANILIACDGANSVVARKVFQRTVDPDFHSGAVRAYFQGVEGIRGSDLLEIHLIKGRLPGYFWIFPLPDGRCNVGFGMLTRDLSARNIDLRESLSAIIRESSELSHRFHSATMEGPVRGFGLPLGGKINKVSADRILLCGDAASLIDPLNGEGIGNAVLSAKMAADWARKAHRIQDYSGGFLSGYDQQLHGRLNKELRFKLRMQRLFNRPWLIETLVRAGAASPLLRDAIASRL